VVQVDVNRPEICLGVETAAGGIGSREGWSPMIRRAGATAAITGTYFCPQSALPVGTIVSGGRPLHAGHVGPALVFTRWSGPLLLSCRAGTGYDWDGAEMVLRAGPRLLGDGQIDLRPRAEGFRDPAIVARKRRSAVGITRGGKLLLVAVEKPVTLPELARALQRLGAAEAMCLDGGQSAGLYYRGRSLVRPRRPLTNLLVVYDSSARYQHHAGRLNPPALRVAAAAGRRG
jgi:exopolysaccharide biosynthesis protein